MLTAPELDLTEALAFTTAESEGIIANTEGEDVLTRPTTSTRSIDRFLRSLELVIFGFWEITRSYALTHYLPTATSG